MIQQVTITTETIIQADDRPKGGRPRKDQPRLKRFKLCGYHISDEAEQAIRRAAEKLGVSQSAIIEALGRTLASDSNLDAA